MGRSGPVLPSLKTFWRGSRHSRRKLLAGKLERPGITTTVSDFALGGRGPQTYARA